jgi:hypothetical protein
VHHVDNVLEEIMTTGTKQSMSTLRLRSVAPYAALVIALECLVCISASAGTTTLSLSNSATSTGAAPVTMNFPVTRSGDIGYDTLLNYHTVDGTAKAGVDYTAAQGSILIPAGSTSATIPVVVTANTTNESSLTFALQLDSAAGIGPPPGFVNQQNFPTGVDPGAISVADINGDGKLDLIVANTRDNTVSVLLNVTGPRDVVPVFAPQQTFATGSAPFSVAIADINGDGKPDLIIVNLSDDTISVLMNTTTPGAAIASFGAQQTLATGVTPYSVTSADLNGDGKPDLIVANLNSKDVSVFLNTTPPQAPLATFSAPQTFSTGSGPQSVATADVNGDGKPDLIVANITDSTIVVLTNMTEPGAMLASFTAPQIVGSGSQVVAADLNGDGKPDLMIQNHVDSTILALVNTTAAGSSVPSFAAPQLVATGQAIGAIIDVNGDGKPDLVALNVTSSPISVLRNTTAPGASVVSFGIPETFASAPLGGILTAADLNGDGKPDLILVTEPNDAGLPGSIAVLTNATESAIATTQFSSQQAIPVGESPLAIVSADINGDGKPDLIVTNYMDSTISVLLNITPPGAVAPSFATQQTFVTGLFPDSIAIADVNGDGKLDLVVTNRVDNTVSVLLNTTSPGATIASFAGQKAFPTGQWPQSVAVADLNGDGKLDLIIGNHDDNTISVLLNTTEPGATTPTFAAQQTFVAILASKPDSLADFVSIAIADINADGMPDIIISNSSDDTVAVLTNTTPPGASIASFAAPVAFPTGVWPSSVKAADVNDDGRADLLTTNLIDSTVSVLINTTPPGAAIPQFAPRQDFYAALSPTFVTTADVNGDGKVDLIVACADQITVLLNTTGFLRTPAVDFASGLSLPAGDSPAGTTAADLNGDGKLDLVATNYFDNTISVVLNSQYQAVVPSNPATGTIVHGYVNLDQHGLTGSWYNPATPGQGFEIEVYPDLGGPGQGLLFTGWFTYDVTASGGRRWYGLSGNVTSADPTASLQIFAVEGGNLAKPPSVGSTGALGQATIQFSDCNTGSLTYSFSDGSGRTGTIPLTRLTANVTCSPSGDNGNAPTNYLLSGNWYDPSASGQGFIFDIDPTINNLFAAWYTFIQNGQATGGPASQSWFTLQFAPFLDGTTTQFGIPIIENTGGVFDNPAQTHAAQVGTANIAFQSCDAMTVNYAFTGGENEGLTGLIKLQRVGPTPSGCSLQ